VNEVNDAAMNSSYTTETQGISPVSNQHSLRSQVEQALQRYFQHIEDAPVTDLHQMVMAEVEAPLLQAVMRHTGNNQSKASIMLGFNRGTLRSRLKRYGLL